MFLHNNENENITSWMHMHTYFGMTEVYDINLYNQNYKKKKKKIKIQVTRKEK